MKPSDLFQSAISDHLKALGATDSRVAEALAKPGKNIEDCCTYILNQVKKSGRHGFVDAEVYGMALHYYDEDDIEVGGKINGSVVVNHAVELTPEEIERARKEAYTQKVLEEKNRLKREAIEATTLELSAEEQEQVRQAAYEKVVDAEKDRLKRRQPAPKEKPAAVQQSLF